MAWELPLLALVAFVLVEVLLVVVLAPLLSARHVRRQSADVFDKVLAPRLSLLLDEAIARKFDGTDEEDPFEERLAAKLREAIAPIEERLNHFEGLDERINAVHDATKALVEGLQAAAMPQEPEKGEWRGGDPREARHAREEIADRVAAAEMAIKAWMCNTMGDQIGNACYEWCKKNVESWRRAVRAYADGRLDTAKQILGPGVSRFLPAGGASPATSPTSSAATVPPM